GMRGGGGGGVAGPGNGAGPAVAARLEALVKLRAEGVDDDGTALLRGGQHRALVDEEARARRGREGGGRIAAGRPALGRPAFGLPLVEAALENGRMVEAERAEHPPEAPGPQHPADTLEHDR